MEIIRQYCRHCTAQAVTVTVNHPGWKEKITREILVPCGQCEYCRRVKQNEWSSRLYAHAIQFQKDNPNGKVFFCTFTISNEWFINHSKELEPVLRDDMPHFVFTGDIDEIQRTPVAKYIYNRYWKAKLCDVLRSVKGVGLDLQYYTCCEFGDHTERIHFHSIFFIKDFEPVKQYVRSRGIKVKHPWFVKGKNCSNGDRRLSTTDERYMETLTDYLWSDFDNKTKERTPIGHTNINLACAKSFRYITKYVCKIKEDVDLNKEPFHRQSFRIGMNEDDIAKALLDNKRYLEINRFGKVYKYRINKYYCDKIAKLLGIKDDLTLQFLEISRKLVAEGESYNKKNYECVVRGIDLRSNELVTIQWGHYQKVTTAERAKYKINGKTRYLWRYIDRLIWFVDEVQTYLNDLPYECKRNENFTEPCETY